MTAEVTGSDWREPFRSAWRAAPGLAIAATVAAAAQFAAATFGGSVMLMALLIGMALNFVATQESTAPGLRHATGPLLQVGVALLGLRIAVDDVLAMGWETGLMVGLCVIMTIGAGVVLARLTGRSRVFGLLAGGATAICGASAALAIAAVLPPSDERERETAFVVVAVTALSTIAMIVYPVIALALGLDDRAAGILLGATIHDVAQVVGAGYSVSAEAGDTATIVKLFRVGLLLPVVLCVALLAANPRKPAPGRLPVPVPYFAVAFALLVGVHSLALLPSGLESLLGEVSQWCLLVAIAGIGLRTSIPKMLRMGVAASSIPFGATLILLATALAFQLLQE